MQVGTGKSVLNGIAIGKLKIYKKKDTAISAAEVADTAAEVARFEEAQQKAIEQQTALYEKALAWTCRGGQRQPAGHRAQHSGRGGSWPRLRPSAWIRACCWALSPVRAAPTATPPFWPAA